MMDAITTASLHATTTHGMLPALATGAPNAGDTAWVLISAALVMLMTPGLAFFYGGMVRSKSVLNMMMMCFTALGLVGILWVLVGFSMAFGDSIGGAGLLGDPLQFLGLDALFEAGGDGSVPLVGTIPALLFVVFQLMFAAIAVALVAGSIADRMRFSAWLIFAGIWALVVYFPVAHWVFAADGLVAKHGGWIISKLGAIDFAGGTAVHICAGTAGLVLALILGARTGWLSQPMRPHNLTLVMIGAALLWFGWIGFNAGSALAANGSAAKVMVTTVVAACAGMLAWLAVEGVRDGHRTSLGSASGVVAGLVGITPACASVDVFGAIAIGAVCGIVCCLAVQLKSRLGYDDSLDVAGIHLTGGLIGVLMIGLFATKSAPTGVAGLFYGGGGDLLWRQAVSAAAVMVYCGIATAVIALIMRKLMRIRVTPDQEVSGIDLAEHAESAYDLGLEAGHSAALGHHTGTV